MARVYRTRTRKLRPPFKQPGGKAYQVKDIVPLLPPHTVYVESFLGGGSILLNKPPAPIEVAGDIDFDVVNAHTMIRDRCGELLQRLREIPYSQESLDWAIAAGPSPDPVEAAARFIVRRRMSRTGDGRSFSWSTRLRGGQPGDLNGWETILDMFPDISDRLQGVQLFCADYWTLTERFDGPDTLHYLDPPYAHETRVSHDLYREHEMTYAEHEMLLERLQNVQGFVVLSGRHCPLYDSVLASWTAVEIEKPNHAGQVKRKRRVVDVAWLNPAASRFALRG